MSPTLQNKRGIIFDLDGTLAESKQPLDAEMAGLLSELLRTRKVAVISGGSYQQFEKQFLPHITGDPAALENLFLFPTSGTSFYRREAGAWKKVYEETLSPEEKAKITRILSDAEEKLSIGNPKPYGKRIEDRESQITYSALGQDAPLAEKKIWDPDQEKRKKMVAMVAPFLSEFSVRIGGTTTIDVTRGGVDKAYGVRQIEKALGIPLLDMVFVGDALYPNGNDYPARATGIECLEVKNIADTKEFIRKALSTT